MDLKETKRIEKLMTLFRGSERAHGMFVEKQSNDPLKPKVKGKAATIPQGPTLKNWIEHYQGKIGLGIIPINSEDQCYWGVLDIDGELDSSRQPLHQWECLNADGTVDHVLLQQNIQKLGLPLFAIANQGQPTASCSFGSQFQQKRCVQFLLKCQANLVWEDAKSSLSKINLTQIEEILGIG